MGFHLLSGMSISAITKEDGIGEILIHHPDLGDLELDPDDVIIRFPELDDDDDDDDEESEPNLNVHPERSLKFTESEARDLEDDMWEMHLRGGRFPDLIYEIISDQEAKTLDVEWERLNPAERLAFYKKYDRTVSWKAFYRDNNESCSIQTEKSE
jgi:hypothetical protein